jgi:site-specific DNA recombinase
MATTIARDPYDLKGLRAALYCRVSQDRAEEKSVNDQEYIGREWATRVGVTIHEPVLRDVSFQASRFAKRERPDFLKLIPLVERDEIDLVWLWDQNRLARREKITAGFAELCRDKGVRWVINGRILDPRNSSDWLNIMIMAAIDALYSAKLSEDVKRGVASSARMGRPYGWARFGYRRFYDATNRRLFHDEPDMQSHNGEPENAPARVVREIFECIANGESMRSIARRLQARGIPTSKPRKNSAKEWKDYLVRSIATNPAYIGVRLFHGKPLEDVVGQWEPLVSTELYEAVQLILSDPSRERKELKGRRGIAKTLLTHIAKCDVCGGWLIANRVGTRLKPGTKLGKPGERQFRGLAAEPGRYYQCKDKKCLGITRHVLDEYVEDRVIAYLADPDIYTRLLQRDNTGEAKRAREEAAKLRLDLAEYRKRALAGEIDAAFYSLIEQDRRARIADAEQRLEEATVPFALRGIPGPDAGKRFRRLTLDHQREIIRATVEIRVKPTGMSAGQARWHGPSVEERVELGPWLLDAKPPAEEPGQVQFDLDV